MMMCPTCKGEGWSIENRDGIRNGCRCTRCVGRGTLPVTAAEFHARQRTIRTELLTSALHPAPPPRDTHEVTP